MNTTSAYFANISGKKIQKTLQTIRTAKTIMLILKQSAINPLIEVKSVRSRGIKISDMGKRLTKLEQYGIIDIYRIKHEKITDKTVIELKNPALVKEYFEKTFNEIDSLMADLLSFNQDLKMYMEF